MVHLFSMTILFVLITWYSRVLLIFALYKASYCQLVFAPACMCKISYLSVELYNVDELTLRLLKIDPLYV